MTIIRRHAVYKTIAEVMFKFKLWFHSAQQMPRNTVHMCLATKFDLIDAYVPTEKDQRAPGNQNNINAMARLLAIDYHHSDSGTCQCLKGHGFEVV